MFELIPHDDIVQDLERLDSVSSEIVDLASATIQQLMEDPCLVDDLLRNGYGGTPKNPARGAVFNVRTWGDAQRQGLNLWAIRDFELSRKGLEFRIVYAVFPENELIYLLAIVEREWNYDLSHEVSRRILSTYRHLQEQL